MSEDTERPAPGTTEPPPIAAASIEARDRDLPPPGSAPRRDVPVRARGVVLATVLALAALAVAAFAGWRLLSLERSRASDAAQVREELAAQLDGLSRSAEQRKRELDGLRARMADADGVNRSLREELLGLGERSRHLEDAVANLAESRQAGRDALAMNEAEFLLQQAQERLRLFHDAAAAITAYRLADSALASAEDPVFASVRQGIEAERQALEASRPLDVAAAIATLERVRGALARLPLPQPEETPAASGPSWRAFLSRFVRISHGRGEEAQVGERASGLTRSLVSLDLRSAEAALFARDPAAWKAALARARSGLAAGFDAGAAPVRQALADLDQLAAAPMAPQLPELGAALRELRNLRATRALAQPRLPAQVPAAPQDSSPQDAPPASGDMPAAGSPEAEAIPPGDAPPAETGTPETTPAGTMPAASSEVDA